MTLPPAGHHVLELAGSHVVRDGDQHRGGGEAEGVFRNGEGGKASAWPGLSWPLQCGLSRTCAEPQPMCYKAASVRQELSSVTCHVFAWGTSVMENETLVSSLKFKN